MVTFSFPVCFALCEDFFPPVGIGEVSYLLILLQLNVRFDMLSCEGIPYIEFMSSWN